MRAIARIALDAAGQTETQHLRDLTQFEQRYVLGDHVPETGKTAADWEQAKATVPIPAGAVVLSWYRELHGEQPYRLDDAPVLDTK